MLSKFAYLRRWLDAPAMPTDTGAAIPGRVTRYVKPDRTDLAWRHQRLLEALYLAGLGHWYSQVPAEGLVLCEICLGLSGIHGHSRPVALVHVLRRIARQDRERLLCRADQSLRDGTRFEVDIRLRVGAGAMRWIRVLGRFVNHNDGAAPRLIGAAMDISEHKAMLEHMQHLALYDGLTGLPNRAMFEHQFSRALVRARRYGKQLALLFIDLDRFKQINDSMGHDAGDQALREAARRLSSKLRRSDLVARLGGDEFVVLLEDIVDAEQPLRVARQIRAAVQEPWMVDGDRSSLAASIGISIFPEDGDDEATLLRHADSAMYLAKRSGGTGLRRHAPCRVQGGKRAD